MVPQEDNAANEIEADSVIEIDVSDLFAMLEEAKKQVRSDIEAAVRSDMEAQIRAEYEVAPVYQGLLGFLAKIIGKAPDSTGRPSSSWTLYLFSHLPVLVYMAAVCYATIQGTSFKLLHSISPFIPLTPMILAWIAWLAHHKKLAEVVISIINAIGGAFTAFKTAGVSSTITTAITTATTAVEQIKQTDNALTPGAKITLKKRETDKPKTDHTTVPSPPEM